MPGKYRNRRRSFRRRAQKSYRRTRRTRGIRGIAKAVRRLQKAARRSRVVAKYQGAVKASVQQPYYGFTLSDHQNNSLNPILGTPASATQTKHAIHYKINLDCYVDLENVFGVNEEGTIQFTAMIVSLRDDIGSSFNPGTGGIVLTQGDDYALNLVANGPPAVWGGFANLNLKKFKIHKMKKFVLTNHEQGLGISSAQTQYGTNYRWTWKLKPKYFFRSQTTSPWSSMHSSNDPSKTFYFLLFNDNTIVDGESPMVQISAIHTYLVDE